MENKEIRRNRMLELATEYGTLKALASKTGTDPAHLSQIKNGFREMGDEVARRIEEKLGKASGWMDAQAALADHEQDLLEKYRRAPAPWRLALRHLAELTQEKQNQVLAILENKHIEATSSPGQRNFYYGNKNKSSSQDAKVKRRTGR